MGLKFILTSLFGGTAISTSKRHCDKNTKSRVPYSWSYNPCFVPSNLPRTHVFKMISNHAVDSGCLRGRYLEPFWCSFNLQGTVQARLMCTRLFWFNIKSFKPMVKAMFVICLFLLAIGLHYVSWYAGLLCTTQWVWCVIAQYNSLL